MRKGALLLALFIVTTSLAEIQDTRQEFLDFYFKGEYDKAHALVNNAITDPIKRQIWDRRIHIHQDLPACDSLRQVNPSLDAFAYLCIGEFENAKKNYTDDWVSLWARALYSQWNADFPAARNQLDQAIALQPENPDLIFFAGDIAETSEKTIEFFTHFLKLNPEDEVKKSIAEFSIDLIKKTAGMQLNVIRVEPGVQQIESDYMPSGLVIEAMVNSKEKMKLLVDTGAGSGLVLEKRDWTPQIVNDVVMLGLGKKQISQTKRVVLDMFQTGKFSIQNPLAAENDHMPFPDIDGLMGSAVFGTHRILMPLKSGKNIVLLPYDLDPTEYFAGNKMNFKKNVTVPFFLVNKLIVVKGRIRKSPEDLDILIDTGANSSLISTATAKKYGTINYPLSMQLRRQNTVSGVGGKSESLLISENVEVGIAGLSRNFNSMLALNLADSNDALGLEIDLLLGRDFLEGYTLLLDYRNRQITFLR